MTTLLEQFCADEPLFAVLNDDRYRTANLTPRIVSDFFDTGEGYVTEVINFIRSHVDEQFSPNNVLEFGCGPGRLAIPFARRVSRVVGVDTSPAMLACARRFADELQVPNIELLSPDLFAVSEERFDLVNCYFVLQRLPQKVGLQLIRTLLERIKGIGVLHLPYRDTSSVLAKATRRIRLQSRAANLLANVILRKPLTAPLIRSTAYDTNGVLDVCHELGFTVMDVTTSSDGPLKSATFFVRRQRGSNEATMREPVRVVNEDLRAIGGQSHIDVRQLVATTPLEVWNERAEEYFAGLSNWEHHITKPFSKVEEAPALLINLAVMLQGLRLAPGDTVLDFGAGTGWLSRYLTQLGCRAILLDVSATALRIAEEAYRQIPTVGDRPVPVFLRFDGRRIDLSDESVDRIVCFDAFHHSPNPEEVILEFGRILRPGGVASFAEPGPTHSQMAQSQYEMRTYGVLENDIDLPELWRVAQKAGFSSLRVAAFNIPPFHVSLDQYQDLLDGGKTYTRWADTSRDFLRHVRNFVLTKGDSSEADSRRAEGLRAKIDVEVHTGSDDLRLEFRATVTNIGTSAWLASTDAAGGVWLGCHLYDASGRLLTFEFARFGLSSVGVVTDQSVEITGTLPELPRKACRLEFDCVAEQVTWFSQVGSHTATIDLSS